MKILIYQVDAFADKVFSGNPAAVCPLDNWLPKETLDKSMSALYSELEPFELPYSKSMWKVDFDHMPVETAIEMTQYLMESTIKKQHFNSEVPTVGGEILTAVITKDEGFRLI